MNISSPVDLVKGAWSPLMIMVNLNTTCLMQHDRGRSQHACSLTRCCSMHMAKLANRCLAADEGIVLPLVNPVRRFSASSSRHTRELLNCVGCLCGYRRHT